MERAFPLLGGGPEEEKNSSFMMVSKVLPGVTTNLVVFMGLFRKGASMRPGSRERPPGEVAAGGHSGASAAFPLLCRGGAALLL